MGRKIRPKKHRGVKDPRKQRAKRYSEIAKKINAPPKNIEEQAVPKSLQRLAKLTELVKTGKIGKVVKKKKKVKNQLIKVGPIQSKLHPKAKPDKVVPLFQQNPGENQHHFYHRVCRETDHFIKESEFEKKYNVQVDRNPNTGEIEGVSKCPKDEIDELAKLRAKHKNIKKKKKKKKAKDIDPKLTKSQKRKLKLQMKKEKKEEENMDPFEIISDHVQFGEIVHEPPKLPVKPKNAMEGAVRKPVAKGLLLNSLLNGAEGKTNGAEEKTNSTKNVPIDRMGKRKNLPSGERRQLEKQQKDVIAAYRKLRVQQNAGFGV